jgi:hypothetical protein
LGGIQYRAGQALFYFRDLTHRSELGVHVADRGGQIGRDAKGVKENILGLALLELCGKDDGSDDPYQSTG